MTTTQTTFVYDFPENLIQRADVIELRDLADQLDHTRLVLACGALLMGEETDDELRLVVRAFERRRIAAGNYLAPWALTADEFIDGPARFAAARARIAAGAEQRT